MIYKIDKYSHFLVKSLFFFIKFSACPWSPYLPLYSSSFVILVLSLPRVKSSSCFLIRGVVAAAAYVGFVSCCATICWVFFKHAKFCLANLFWIFLQKEHKNCLQRWCATAFWLSGERLWLCFGQLHISVAGNFYALFAKKFKINLLNKILHV